MLFIRLQTDQELICVSPIIFFLDIQGTYIGYFLFEKGAF
jgi:hypothetical protein